MRCGEGTTADASGEPVTRLDSKVCHSGRVLHDEVHQRPDAYILAKLIAYTLQVLLLLAQQTVRLRDY